MHGFGFFPMFFWPGLLFFGLLKFLFFILLIVLVVRLFSHGHRHAAYAHGYGYGHGRGWSAENMDPRRVAAWRYASGQIDLAEFDRIMGGLDKNTPTPPTA